MSIRTASYDKMMSMNGEGGIKINVSEVWKDFLGQLTNE